MERKHRLRGVRVETAWTAGKRSGMDEDYSMGLLPSPGGGLGMLKYNFLQW